MLFAIDKITGCWHKCVGPAPIKLSPLYDDIVPSPRKSDPIQRTARCLPILKNLCQSNDLHRGAQQRSRWVQVDGRVRAVGGTPSSSWPLLHFSPIQGFFVLCDSFISLLLGSRCVDRSIGSRGGAGEGDAACG
jgi:hypothetical protein